MNAIEQTYKPAEKRHSSMPIQPCLVLGKLFVAFLISLLFSPSIKAQAPQFTPVALDFIYNTPQYPPTIVDTDGDGREELIRFSTEGVYIDFFSPTGGRYTRHLSLNLQHPPKWSVCSGDVDQNGLPDFIMAGDKKVSLLKPNGNTYTEMVLDGSLVSQRSNMVDVDGDGDLDVFVCNDEGANFFYENDGKGNLNVSSVLDELSPLAGNYSSLWTDINGDLLPDLYLSKCFANVPPGDLRRKNLLYKNKGNGQFEEIGQQAGVADSAQTWTTAFEDFDNDGDMDAYVLNHDLSNRLFRNNGNETFTDVIATSGLDPIDYSAFEVATADFNNDGFLDILTDQEQSLYLGNGDLTFVPVVTEAKAGAVGDVNNDGFIDVFRARTLYQNVKNENHWIKFFLTGIQSNKNGIGAKIKVYTSDYTQTRELRSGQGYAAMSGLQIHFGLGQQSGVDSVYVFWPSGKITTLRALDADTLYEITEFHGPSEPARPEIIDSFMCQSPMYLHAPSLTGSYLWSTGDTTRTLAIDEPGIYTAFRADGNGSWQPVVRYRIQLENNSPPVFLRDSIVQTACLGSEISLPWYEDGDVVASQNWEGKKHVLIREEGWYTIEKALGCLPGQILTDTINVAYLSVEKPRVDSTHWTQDSVTFYSSDPNTLWYEDDISNQPLAEGPSYTGSIAFLFNKVFLEAFRRLPNPVLSGGRKNAMGASASFPKRDLYFSINEEMILHSFDMYVLQAENEGSRRISITTEAGDTLAVFSPFLTAGKNVVNLDIKLNRGRYKLGCDRSDQAMNAGEYNYPYPLAHLGSIDSCSESVNFYPYYYNWQFSGPSRVCTSERNIFIWLSSEEQPDTRDLELYPNPANEMVYINSGLHKPSSFTISKSDGTSVMEGEISEEKSISVAHLLPGIYWIKFDLDDRGCVVKKVVIIN